MMNLALAGFLLFTTSLEHSDIDRELLTKFEGHQLELSCASSIRIISTEYSLDETIRQLSGLKRTGWLRNGIPTPQAESVWEHTLKVVKAAKELHIAMPHLSLQKLVLLAFVHDLAEAHVGDITPHDGIAGEEKYGLERAAIQNIANRMGALGDRLIQLWLEFEDGESEEARLLKQLDKLDAFVQAIVYANQGFAVLSEFQEYTDRRITDPHLRYVFDRLVEGSTLPDDPYQAYFRLLGETR